MNKKQQINTMLWEYTSIWGVNWILGKYLLPKIKYWGEKVNGKLLDVGCGEKPYAIFFKNVYEYIGLDQQNKKTKADIFGDALNLPFTDNSIDICFNSWILDDINEPNAYFYEINRVLKKGGLSIMIECQTFPEHDAPHDYFRFTRYGLKYLAEKNGFIVEEMAPLGGFWAQIGTQLAVFFIQGAMGKIGRWIRIFIPLINILFFLFDRINFLPRGTIGYFAVFKKNE